MRSFLPGISSAETVLRRGSRPGDNPTPAFELFEGNLAQADFKKNWEPFRKKAGARTYFIAGFVLVLPKIGPLSMLSIRGPDRVTHERYVESVNASNAYLRSLLADHATTHAVPNRDLDTGEATRPGAYPLTDRTYAKLLDRLTSNPGSALPAALKDNILQYYSDPAAPIATKADPKQWKQVQSDFAVLRTMRVSPAR